MSEESCVAGKLAELKKGSQKIDPPGINIQRSKRKLGHI